MKTINLRESWGTDSAGARLEEGKELLRLISHVNRNGAFVLRFVDGFSDRDRNLSRPVLCLKDHVLLA